MADRDRAAELREERERLERLVASHERALHAPQRDEGGELADYDQHQADQATETYMREDDLGRVVDYRRRIDEIRDEELALAGAAPAAPGPDLGHAAQVIRETPDVPDDDRTPLDEVEPGRTPDLADIPLTGDPADVQYDPQERDDMVDMDMPGGVYAQEGGAPDVGDADPDDPALRRGYRPD